MTPLVHLNDFFHDYAAAFVAGNAQRLSELYEYPLYIRHNEQNHVFNIHQFRQNLEALCSHYQTHNIQRFMFEIVRVFQVGTLNLVHLKWQGFDREQKPLDQFECCYLVSHTQKAQAKILSVININEVIVIK